ncbi:MAG: diaminobutyrate--2-oxoglutarate transaminase [Acidimicrobiales bacterium]
MESIEQHESQVRSYCRGWPTTFVSGRGATLTAADGREYVDFFAGAGALNYGHNDPTMRDALIDYLTSGGVIHGLDMATAAKERFLDTFHDLILAPRNLDYVVQFPGPTGTNAVEAALKLARKVKGRDGIASFTNGFHGMTLGALAVTGNAMKREGAGVPLTNTVNLPFEGFHGSDVDTIELIARVLDQDGSGVDLPAAVIVETVQAEGGIHVASMEWLRRLREVCDELDMLLIVDDIQAGCGRTGSFFSFEEAGIEPDIVCLSKSISGFGLPMALTLFRREHDIWIPGEHNGTFRGNNAAFVTGTVALEKYWGDSVLSRETQRKSAAVRERLSMLAEAHPGVFGEVRGRGLIQGIDSLSGETADLVTTRAFELGLLLETAGPDGEITKLLPSLTIEDDLLDRGLTLLEQAVEDVVDREGARLLEVAEAN